MSPQKVLQIPKVFILSLTKPNLQINTHAKLVLVVWQHTQMFKTNLLKTHKVPELASFYMSCLTIHLPMMSITGFSHIFTCTIGDWLTLLSHYTCRCPLPVAHFEWTHWTNCVLCCQYPREVHWQKKPKHYQLHLYCMVYNPRSMPLLNLANDTPPPESKWVKTLG